MSLLSDGRSPGISPPGQVVAGAAGEAAPKCIPGNKLSFSVFCWGDDREQWCLRLQQRNLLMNGLDKRQGRSNDRGHRGWLRWFCNPRVLKLLIQFGLVLFSILKALTELVKLLKS